LPWAAGGSVEATIAKGGAATEIVIAVDFFSLGLLVSLRVTLKEKFPTAEGVPEITPVDVARASPEGSEPDVTFQV
jgi:hypothetical protein